MRRAAAALAVVVTALLLAACSTQRNATWIGTNVGVCVDSSAEGAPADAR